MPFCNDHSDKVEISLAKCHENEILFFDEIKLKCYFVINFSRI